MNREVQIEEARAFAQACEEFSHGELEPFYRKAFHKVAEIINGLCDELSTETELSTGKVINMAVINKEKGKGKETFPPAPPIEKRESQEKATTTTTRAHTREESGCSYVGPLWDEVLRYVKHAKIDTDYALWWYGQMSTLGWCDPDNINEPIGNWKQLLRGWWRQRGKSGDDWKRQAEAKPRQYSRAEWALCAERCAHYDAKCCRCCVNCAIPPDKRPVQIPPEECERFKPINKENVK